MEDSFPVIINVILVLLLVFANGFFVAAEFAIVRARVTKLKSDDSQAPWGTKAGLKLIHDLDDSLSATQLGITIASLILGWWGEHTFAQVFSGWFSALGEPYSQWLSHTVATILALALITFLHVVLGELAAKSLAIRFPEKTLGYIAPAMLLFTRVCRPIVYILAACANLFLRMFGITTPAESVRAHSLAELALLVAQSAEKGELDADETEMLRGVFGFSDTVAREVMTPRTDLVSINVNESFEQVLEIIGESGLSRFPVVGENIDDVQGVLLARDIVPFLSKTRGRTVEQFSVVELMREPYFIPETKPVDDLLNEMKVQKTHMAIVLDEHGGVDGVVTLEDLLEEIVGDIFDESDTPEKDYDHQENGDVFVDGGVLVTDLNERFELRIPEGDYDTVAGFILTCLGRMPEVGDTVRVRDDGVFSCDGSVNGEADVISGGHGGDANGSAGDGAGVGAEVAILRVERLEGHRIETIRLQPLP